MGGGGGGNVDIMQRKFPAEKKQIGNFYGFQENQLGGFRAGDPYLSAGGTAALGYNQQLPGMLAQYPGFNRELQGAQGQLGGLFGNLSGLSGKLGGLVPQVSGYQQQGQGLFGQLSGLSSRLSGIYNAAGGPAGIIASGGKLSPELLRNAQQQSLDLQSRAGTARTSGGLAQTVLESDAAREARLSQAQQVGQQLTSGQAGIEGQQGGILGLLSGLTGQKAGIYGQQANINQLQQSNRLASAGLTGQRANLLGQQQGLQTGGLNQLLGIGNAGVSQYGALTNPALSYLQGVFGGNLQARAQQAQINAGINQASSQGFGDMIGGIISAIGPIIGAIAMSDKRLKTKIKDTGMRTPDGIPLKTFEYKTRPGVSLLGVIAQDVARKRPDAVHTDPLSGVKSVNLWKLGAPTVEIKGG